MSSSRDRDCEGSPDHLSADIRAPHIHCACLGHFSSRRNNNLGSGRPSAIVAPNLTQTPRSSLSLANLLFRYDSNLIILPSAAAYPHGWPNSIGFEGLAITAIATVTVQFSMVTSSSMATTTAVRALLFFGMTLELLAMLLAICFHSTGDLPSLLRLASGVPIVLLLMGIVVFAAALVMEMLKTSPGTAAAMGGFIVLSIILCLLASFFRVH